MKNDVYNVSGKKIGTVDLPESVFSAAWNGDLVHQVATTMAANARTPVAHTKFRSEVSGGGKKPWRQKGTGRARHGSRRSPIWIGGGVTFGPRNERTFGGKINRKMKNMALRAVLSAKVRDGEVLFVDDLSFTEPKTKQAKDVLAGLGSVKGFEALATKRSNAALVFAPKKDEMAVKSFSNFGNVKVGETRNMNVLDLLRYKFVIIARPDESVAVLKHPGQNKTEE